MCSVPQAGQGFLVEGMTSPARDVWQLQKEADRPEADAYDDSVPLGVDLRVEVMAADVDVAVEADGPDAVERAEAGN